MADVKTFSVVHAEAPSGGLDNSGRGREGGRKAFRDDQITKLTHMIWT